MGFREVFDEVKNLGERVQRSEPLNPCYNLPLGTRNSLQGGLAKPKFRRVIFNGVVVNFISILLLPNNMNYQTKALAAIGTGLAPVIPAYWKTMEYFHDKFVSMQSSEIYQNLEGLCANVTQHSDPERLTNLATVLTVIGMTFVTAKVAEPLVKFAAKAYKVELR